MSEPKKKNSKVQFLETKNDNDLKDKKQENNDNEEEDSYNEKISFNNEQNQQQQNTLNSLQKLSGANNKQKIKLLNTDNYNQRNFKLVQAKQGFQQMVKLSKEELLINKAETEHAKGVFSTEDPIALKIKLQQQKQKEMQKTKEMKQDCRDFFDEDKEQPPFENARITQAFFSRYLLFDMSCTCVAIMGVVLSAIEYELEYEDRYEKCIDAILWVIFISSILNALFTVIRYQSMIDYKISRREISPKGTLFNTGLIYPCFFEFILVLIGPMPFFHGIKINFKNDWSGDTNHMEVYYLTNEILSLMGCSKLFLVFRSLLMNSNWYTNRSHRVLDMYGIQPSLLFVSKCQMEYTPYRFITGMYIITVVFFGFGLHITESALSRGSEVGFNDYWNSFWCIIVTMTTVGYGDYFPHSNLGRIIILIVCVQGTFVTSLMILSLTNTLKTSMFENRAICVLDKLEARKKRKHLAAQCLTQLAILGTGIKKGKIEPDGSVYSKKRIRLIKTIKQFTKANQIYKDLNDENLTEILQRESEMMQKEMLILKKEQQEVLIQKIEIMKRYKMPQAIVQQFEMEIDPALVSEDSSDSDGEDDKLSASDILSEPDSDEKSEYKENRYQGMLKRNNDKKIENIQKKQIKQHEKQVKLLEEKKKQEKSNNGNLLIV